ncbi:MAG TPA: DUF4328 domain-containing protein [Frankiaceae bacterium]|nr:DUF4328 domain-containing protein [Frankiaceae bacterium]
MTTTYDADDAAFRAKPLVRFLYLNVPVWAAAAVLTFTLDTSAGYARGDDFDRQVTMIGTCFALYVVTGVLWVRWFKAVAYRTQVAGRARFRDAWWFWAWVIPGASLVLPKMMVNDAWRAPDPTHGPEPLPAAVQWWWALWVATGVANFVGNRLDVDVSPGLGKALAAAYFVATAVEAVLAVRVVRFLTARDRLLGTSPASV